MSCVVLLSQQSEQGSCMKLSNPPCRYSCYLTRSLLSRGLNSFGNVKAFPYCTYVFSLSLIPANADLSRLRSLYPISQSPRYTGMPDVRSFSASQDPKAAKRALATLKQVIRRYCTLPVDDLCHGRSPTLKAGCNLKGFAESAEDLNFFTRS